MSPATSPSNGGAVTAATAQPARRNPLPVVYPFGDWVMVAVCETNADRVFELTGMTVSRLRKQTWLPLRREGNGTGTRFYLYKADLIAALERLPRD